MEEMGTRGCKSNFELLWNILRVQKYNVFLSLKGTLIVWL